MRNKIAVSIIILLISLAAGCAPEQTFTGAGGIPDQWVLDDPIFTPGPIASFDEAAVKDPSIVYHDGKWHMFYTAVHNNRTTIGYVSAKSLNKLQNAKRSQLRQLHGQNQGSFIAAPQVFYFKPQKTWYLIYQTNDARTQPVYSTNTNLEDYKSWTSPQKLIEKNEPNVKWVDFWVICDNDTAYLFYSRAGTSFYVRTTSIKDFPAGFGPGQLALAATAKPTAEAAHIYKAKGRNQYHMFYETNTAGYRRYALATAENPLGPWTKVTEEYATPLRLYWPKPEKAWTEDISHGEMLRTGIDQNLEYDPDNPEFLVQGMAKDSYNGNYPSWPWRLGIARPGHSKNPLVLDTTREVTNKTQKP